MNYLGVVVARYYSATTDRCLSVHRVLGGSPLNRVIFISSEVIQGRILGAWYPNGHK